MTNNQERARIRAARYVPSRQFERGMEETLTQLPRRRRRSLQDRAMVASALAAALTLFIVFAAPPIVRAAAPLFTRLFGQVVEEIEQEQRKPDDVKLQEMIEGYEQGSRWHKVEGASAMFQDVSVSVATVDVRPKDYYDQSNPEGELLLSLTYSKIPPFDPNYAAFTVHVDGKDIPLRVDEGYKEYYLDRGQQTLTQEEWENASGGNSWLSEGVPTTWIWFDVDDWRWDNEKQLELKATISGQELVIPFTFDPQKAHEQAIEMAKLSVALGEDNYAHERDELEAMLDGAAPLGISGSAYGIDYEVSEMSLANGKLYFTAAFSGVKGENAKSAKFAGFDYWLGSVTVDGMACSGGGSGNDTLSDGNYTAVYHTTLCRDPNKLPQESLIAFELRLGDNGVITDDKGGRVDFNTVDVAFRYNWAEKKVTLAADEAEMKAWTDEARALADAYAKQYDKEVYYDLSGLGLRQNADDLELAFTGIGYNGPDNNMVLYVNCDDKASKYRMGWGIDVKVNGQKAQDNGSQWDASDRMTRLYINPPLHISEFGDGTAVEIDVPLFLKDRDLEAEQTNYPTPDEILHYEFTIDGNTMQPTDSPDYLLHQQEKSGKTMIQP